MKSITHAINTFKIFIIFIYLSFFYLKCENFFTLTLQYHDSKEVSQQWDLNDLNLIALLKDIHNFSNQNYLIPLNENQNYITHEYLKNLITGNFINESITKYISDYNYFVGSEINISLPYNKNYEPFPTSLQYKVLKDNQDFFLINMQYEHEEVSINDAQKRFIENKKLLKDNIKIFLYAYTKRNPLSLFNINHSDLTLTKNAQKISVNSPFIINLDTLENLDQKVKESITWIDLSNSIIFNLDFDLCLLKNIFPNLHKVSVKNTHITKIDQRNIEFLKQLQKENQAPESEPENPMNFLDEEGMMIDYAADSKINDENIPENKVKEMKDYTYQINNFSFVLELDGCLIQNPEAFLALQNTNPNIQYKKAICIKGVKVKGLSPFKRKIAQLMHKKKSLIEWFLINAINAGLITTVFIKNPELILRILLIGLYAIPSLITAYAYLDDVLRHTSLIDPTGLVFD